MKVRIRTVVSGAMMIVLAALHYATGAQITLEWDPTLRNSDGSAATDLTGYKVHYGTASQTYDRAVTVVGATRATICDLEDGRRYYFSVTACNADSSESEFSGELAWEAPQYALNPPGRIRAITSDTEASGGLIVSWNAQGGTTYLVEISEDLHAWTTAPNGDGNIEQSIVAPLTDGVVSYRDVTAGNASRRFYRVRAM